MTKAKAPPAPKVCPVCGGEFVPKARTRNQKVCSVACRRERNRQLWQACRDRQKGPGTTEPVFCMEDPYKGRALYFDSLHDAARGPVPGARRQAWR